MNHLPATTVYDELLQLWQSLNQTTQRTREHTSLVFEFVRLLQNQISTLDARVTALEGGKADTTEVSQIKRRISEVEADLQTTKDVLDIEAIEKRLAAMGFVSEEPIP